MVATCISAGMIGGLICAGCTTLINLPGVHVNVSETGVFIDVWGAPQDITEDLTSVDLTGIEPDP